jgi:hypothetical protein
MADYECDGDEGVLAQPREKSAPVHPHCYPVGYGTPIDLNDKHGNPVHVGDTLMFDEDEWGSEFKPYVVKIEEGEIQLYGSPSDVPQFCEIVKRWDQTG